jgi:hypothetical protein
MEFDTAFTDFKEEAFQNDLAQNGLIAATRYGHNIGKRSGRAVKVGTNIQSGNQRIRLQPLSSVTCNLHDQKMATYITQQHNCKWKFR